MSLQYPSMILERNFIAVLGASLQGDTGGSSGKGSLKKTGNLSIVIALKRTSLCICHTSVFLQTVYPYSVPHTCETTLFAIHLFLPI